MLHAGTVPDGRHPWRCLFNTDVFYALRGEHALHLALVGGGTELGEVTYPVGGGEAGWSAPYGGPDYVRGYWRPELIHDALAQIPREVKVVRCKPGSYGDNEAATVSALLSWGWRVAACDLNYVIDLPGCIDDWEAAVPRQTRTGIARGEALGLKVTDLDGDDLWAEAFWVLRENRRAKNRALSLDLDYILSIRDAFPGCVRMIGAADDTAIVAAALIYRVAAGRDVVQFWGDSGHDLPFSPMPLLVREVVQHTLQTGASRLDLGISTEGSVPNGGLCRFKRSMGARAEPRFVLGR